MHSCLIVQTWLSLYKRTTLKQLPKGSENVVSLARMNWTKPMYTFKGWGNLNSSSSSSTNSLCDSRQVLSRSSPIKWGDLDSVNSCRAVIPDEYGLHFGLNEYPIASPPYHPVIPGKSDKNNRLGCLLFFSVRAGRWEAQEQEWGTIDTFEKQFQKARGSHRQR